jgi:transposase
VVPSGLSDAEKNALIISQQATIGELQATIASLQATIVELQATIAELKAQLAADSTKSNRPPSSDGLKKKPPKPRSLREKTGKKTGGQPGNPGKTLEWEKKPDHIIAHAPPAVCDSCNAALPEPEVFASRQVFDLPEIRYEVTEHRAMQSQCACGKLHRGSFPPGVDAPMQYGPRLEALAVYLTQQQMLPIERTSDLISDLFGLPCSQATVVRACTDAADLLAPTVDAIGAALQDVGVANADETGMRVEAKSHWRHTLVTPLVTWLGIHKQRGREAMDHFGILPKFRGTLIHDGWESYRTYKEFSHGLCNAHHLRELKAQAEDYRQQWAQQTIALLQAGCHEVNESAEKRLSPERLVHYLQQYDTLLCAGERENPLRARSGKQKRGRTGQSKATNLLRRLRDYTDDVWRFASEPDVPFTNNLAEQAVRMPKVKQKISGGFRTMEGAERFCVIRSYMETMRKQGHHLLETLTQAFRGSIPQPRLS